VRVGSRLDDLDAAALLLGMLYALLLVELLLRADWRPS
jgi:hypothetical protein